MLDIFVYTLQTCKSLSRKNVYLQLSRDLGKYALLLLFVATKKKKKYHAVAYMLDASLILTGHIQASYMSHVCQKCTTDVYVACCTDL